ncbi:MAG: sulfatase [Candidatus Abyssubacteria bacterium]
MKRREFIRKAARTAAAATVGLGLGQSFGCGRTRPLPSSEERPNILLIVADDLGWKDLSCYGNEQVRTPNIDRLAEEGVRFTNAFVTASSCSPSRASLITGQYPHTNGVTGLTHVHKRNMLSPFRVTVADMLSECGYNTALEGKWHIAPYLPVGWYGYQERLSGILPADFWIRSSDKALNFIGENRRNAFYLELNYMNTHREDSGEFHFVDAFPVDPERIHVPDYYALPDWPEIRTEVAKYYSNMLKMDFMIGEVLKKLDEEGIADNTLVCFVSDNGAPFPGNKMTLYDRGIGTPLIIRWPRRIPAGATIEQLVSTLDIMPTLLHAANSSVPEQVQGISLLRLATGTSAEPVRDAVFAEMTHHVNYLPTRAVRTDRWKYIRNYSDDAVGLDQCGHMEWARRLCELPNQGWLSARMPEELYDVECDPNEQQNLVHHPDYTLELENLRNRLDRHMKETGDPFLGRPFERNFVPKQVS